MVIKIELGNYNSELGRIDYTEYFANGKAFYEVCEKTDWSKVLSVSFGSDIKNNNLKLKASGTLAEIETIQSYKHIKISIDNVLYFMGYGSTVSKNFENDLTVDADISFDSYAKTFKGFEHTGNLVEYTSGYKICSPADQSHSMLHILAGYIIDNAQEECHATFNLICTYADTADCGYVSIDSGDSYIDKFSDFLKQNGLGFYVDKTNIVIYDMVANHSGTATTAQNVEAKLTINEKPYNNTKLAQIKYGTIQTITNVKVARIATSIRGASGQDTLEGDVTLDLNTSNQNVKVLQIKNPVRKFYTDEGVFGGKIIVQEWYAKPNTNGRVWHYKLYNSSYTKKDFELEVRATVVYADYSSTLNPTQVNIKVDVDYNKVDECNYIHDKAHAERYFKALVVDSKNKQKEYTFKSTSNFDLGSLCAISDVTTTTALVIMEKTHKIKDEDVYEYKAVEVLDMSEISFDTDYEPAQIDLPAEDDALDISFSRTIVPCDSDNTAKDSTPIYIKIVPRSVFAEPVLIINGVQVELERGTETEESEDLLKAWYYYEYDVASHLAQETELVFGNGSYRASQTITRIIDTVASPVTVVEYAYGDADGPYESALGYTDDEDYVFLGYLENEDTIVLGSVAEWGKEALTPRHTGEYVWQRIGSYLPPQTEEEIDNWAISRLGAYDKALELFVESDVAYRDLRTPSQVNMLRVVVSSIGFASRYSVKFYENTTDGSLYGHYDRETGYLTIPYDVNSAIKQIIGVVTLTDTDGKVYTSSKSIKIVDRTTLGAVFGEVTTVPTDTTYIEGGETKNYLANDSKIYIQDSFSLTDDTYFVENEEYYKKVGNDYVLATDVEAGQPVTPNAYYIKTVIKTIYVFNGTSWDILTANYSGFEQISLDNIPYVFADPRVNIADANGLTWIKNLVAQSVSSIYYFVGKGGAIYSGSYKRDGSNPTNGNGIYISSDGYVEVNGIDVKGNSYIHGDSLVGGTLINTYEYDVNNVHKEQPIFRTNKSQSGSVTLNAQNKADTLAFLYSELPSAIKNYYASRITKNALLPVNNAYFCGQSVTHICYGQLTLPQAVDRTYINTGDTSTFGYFNFVIPAGTPPIVYSYDLRATRSVNDSLFNSGTTYGKIELIVVRNGQTITTWLNKGVTIGSWTSSKEYATSTYQLQGGDDVTVRFYGCRIAGKDKYVTQKTAYCDHFSPQSQIGNSNELNLFRSGTYLGTPTSIVAGMSGYCTNLTTGFVNMHPTTGWTGTTPMSLNGSNWSLSAVNKFYKLQWNGLAPTKTTAVSTFTSDSYVEFNGTRYNSTQIISIIASSTSIQFIVLASQGSTQQVVTFLLNSYANSGTFKVATESPSALLGAYSLNLLPISDYDSEAITDPSQAGNVGTSSDPWTIGFATQGWQQGSARKLKEDITKYQGNATELLESTEIFQFYYKGTTGEQRYINIGFIADDTDALLSSPKHNVQVTGSCVGLLIKAVQELSNRIKQLEEK